MGKKSPRIEGGNDGGKIESQVVLISHLFLQKKGGVFQFRCTKKPNLVRGGKSPRIERGKNGGKWNETHCLNI